MSAFEWTRCRDCGKNITGLAAPDGSKKYVTGHIEAAKWIRGKHRNHQYDCPNSLERRRNRQIPPRPAVPSKPDAEINGCRIYLNPNGLAGLWGAKVVLESGVECICLAQATKAEALANAEAQARELSRQTLLMPVDWFEQQARRVSFLSEAERLALFTGESAADPEPERPQEPPAQARPEPEPKGHACSRAEMGPQAQPTRRCDRCQRLAWVRKLGSSGFRFCPGCYQHELNLRRLAAQAREEAGYRR